MICIACEEMGTNCSQGVCRWCMEEAPFDMDTPPDTVVGVLMDGVFYCEDCESWFIVNPVNRVRVYRVNIGFYSQVCVCCRKVIVAGASPVVLFSVPYEASRKVLQ